jgi:hypothetical protein
MSASMTATGWLVRGLGRLNAVERQLADLSSRTYPASTTGTPPEPVVRHLTGLPPVHTPQGGRDILAAFWTPEARAALGVVRQLLRPPA